MKIVFSATATQHLSISQMCFVKRCPAYAFFAENSLSIMLFFCSRLWRLYKRLNFEHTALLHWQIHLTVHQSIKPDDMSLVFSFQISSLINHCTNHSSISDCIFHLCSCSHFTRLFISTFPLHLLK